MSRFSQFYPACWPKFPQRRYVRAGDVAKDPFPPLVGHLVSAVPRWLSNQGESVPGGTNRVSSAMRSLGVVLFCAVASLPLYLGNAQLAGATEPFRLFRMSKGNPSPYDQRQEIIAELPLDRLTSEAKDRILGIAQHPTLYRRLPTQAITCEPEMFLFLTRQPEVMVGIWELMGITEVQTKRQGPYHLTAQDGSGTECSVDLIYGDSSLHLYTAEGIYDGPMVAGKIRGRGVFVVRSSYATGSMGQTTVTGTIDCFVQIDNLGADLIARTLSGLIGRSADYNFTETARFMSQVSLASQQNTAAMIDVAKRISQVDETTRQDFVMLIANTAAKPSAKRVRELLEQEEGGFEPNDESEILEARKISPITVEPETLSIGEISSRSGTEPTAADTSGSSLR